MSRQALQPVHEIRKCLVNDEHGRGMLRGQRPQSRRVARQPGGIVGLSDEDDFAAANASVERSQVQPEPVLFPQ